MCIYIYIECPNMYIYVYIYICILYRIWRVQTKNQRFCILVLRPKTRLIPETIACRILAFLWSLGCCQLFWLVQRTWIPYAEGHRKVPTENPMSIHRNGSTIIVMVAHMCFSKLRSCKEASSTVFDLEAPESLFFANLAPLWVSRVIWVSLPREAGCLSKV